MKKITCLSAAALMIFCVFSAGWCEDVKKNAKISPEAASVEALALAGRLAEYGRSAKNPGALLVAAQIMKNNPAKKGDLVKEVEGKNGQAPTPAEAKNIDTPEKLLGEAKAMSNDPGFQALVDKEMKIEASRGSSCPIKTVDVIPAEAMHMYKHKFKANEIARVGLVGDGESDLDITVHDDKFNFIGDSTTTGNVEYVEWVPVRDGIFRIKVKNNGRKVSSEYVLITN